MFFVRQILTWPADKMDIRRQGVVYGVTAIQLGEAQSQICPFFGRHGKTRSVAQPESATNWLSIITL